MNKEIVENISTTELRNSIANLFYNRNFGLKTKSDIELLMFKLYFDSALELATKDDVVDEKLISDYKIGRELGITPTRVHNLRLKMDLQFAEENYKWEKDLQKVLLNKQNFSKSEDNKYIIITVRNQNLFNAVEDWIEDNGKTLDLTLNSKQLKIPKKEFYPLLKYISLIDETENSEMLANLANKIKIEGYMDNVIEFGLKALNTGKTVADIMECVSGANLINKTAKVVIENTFDLFKANKKGEN